MNKQGPGRIPYCDYTWSPVTGCLHGCDYCFARRIAERFKGSKTFPNGFEPMLHPERLEEPLKLKKPSRIFVSDMGDLFGDWVPKEWINAVLRTTWECPQHTFLFLTKNPKRYKEFDFPENAWLGTSVENQAAADERIPLLLQTPAAVRFISAEPLLGELDLSKWIGDQYCCSCGYRGFDVGPEDDTGEFTCPQCGADEWYFTGAEYHGALDEEERQSISWCIVGGESGPGARPCHPDWVRSFRDQCQAAGTKFFFKQFGEWSPVGEIKQTELSAGIRSGSYRYVDINGNVASHSMIHDCLMQRVGKKKAGRLLDGRTWDEMPEVNHG